MNSPLMKDLAEIGPMFWFLVLVVLLYGIADVATRIEDRWRRVKR